MPATPTPLPAAPLSDREIDELQSLLEALPAPLEPPDLSALDGFLVGVLLQPVRVPEVRWLAWVHDFDAARAPPLTLHLPRLHALVRRRHAELDAAIEARRWFDPWVFEPDEGGTNDGHGGDGDDATASQLVLPWVAGFSAALEHFPALLERAGPAAREPLAVLFAHFDPDDLEDVDDLAELIEEIAPPETAEEAVESLVRSTLLLADAMRPRGPAPLTPRGPRARSRR